MQNIMINSVPVPIDKALVDRVDAMNRAERHAAFLAVFGLERYSGLTDATDDVAERLCEKRGLIHIWRSKDPRTIPATKLKLLLRSYIEKN